MNKSPRNTILLSLLSASCLLLPAIAHARLPMDEMEHVQGVVRVVEIVTFFTTVSVVVLIWRISSRSKKSRDRNQDSKEKK